MYCALVLISFIASVVKSDNNSHTIYNVVNDLLLLRAILKA